MGLLCLSSGTCRPERDLEREDLGRELETTESKSEISERLELVGPDPDEEDPEGGCSRYLVEGEGGRVGAVCAFRERCPGIVKKCRIFLNGAAIGERVEFSFVFGVSFGRFVKSADCAERVDSFSFCFERFGGDVRSVDERVGSCFEMTDGDDKHRETG